MASRISTDDQLSKTFSALSHPVRRQILTNLSSGKATVSELAEPFEISLPAITRHLKVLQNANLITKTKDAQMRFAHLDAEPLQNASNWLDKYRKFWVEKFDRLQSYVDSIHSEVTKDEE